MLISVLFQVHCGGTIDGGLSRLKGERQIPGQWIAKANSHETLRISEGFGAKGTFFLWDLPATNGG